MDKMNTNLCKGCFSLPEKHKPGGCHLFKNQYITELINSIKICPCVECLIKHMCVNVCITRIEFGEEIMHIDIQRTIEFERKKNDR